MIPVDVLEKPKIDYVVLEKPKEQVIVPILPKTKTPVIEKQPTPRREPELP